MSTKFENHPTLDEIRADIIERITLLADARSKLSMADRYVGEAQIAVDQAWKEWAYAPGHSPQCKALGTVIGMTMDNITEKLLDAATQAGFLMARDVIAPVARTSSQPVEWLTGNSYMPPLRSLPEAEQVYQADEDGDVWSAFYEKLEAQLQIENVLMECPDYDNALYVVDLMRWDHIELTPDQCNDPNLTLNDEWQVRT